MLDETLLTRQLRTRPSNRGVHSRMEFMLTPFEADNLSILPGIKHGFFTREGGTSSGLYRSLNCGAGSNDNRVNVIENRARIANHLGSALGDVQTLYQVHSGDAIIVDQLTDRETLAKADALVTRTRGLAIGVLTADCCPVLFADPEAKVVGAAHAGWRGAFGGVLEATVRAMEQIGAKRANIYAAYGPTINQAAYEVGPEFVDVVLARDPALKRLFKAAPKKPSPANTGPVIPGQDGKQLFDLPEFVKSELAKSSLMHIDACAHCTYRNESLFYSYRRSQQRGDQDYGRQISAIVVA
jgi:polyphenol oxidase